MLVPNIALWLSRTVRRIQEQSKHREAGKRIRPVWLTNKLIILLTKDFG
jgi:hypothetical protein